MAREPRIDLRPPDPMTPAQKGETTMVVHDCQGESSKSNPSPASAREKILDGHMPDIAGTFAADFERVLGLLGEPTSANGSNKIWQAPIGEGEAAFIITSFFETEQNRGQLWDLVTREQSHVAHVCELFGLGAIPQENTRGLIEIMDGGGWLPKRLLLMHRPWAELNACTATESSPYLQVVQAFA